MEWKNTKNKNKKKHVWLSIEIRVICMMRWVVRLSTDRQPIYFMCMFVCCETAVQFNKIESSSLISYTNNNIYLPRLITILLLFSLFYSPVILSRQWFIECINIGTGIRWWSIAQWNFGSIWSTTISNWTNWKEATNSTASQCQVSVLWNLNCVCVIHIDKFGDKNKISITLTTKGEKTRQIFLWIVHQL